MSRDIGFDQFMGTPQTFTNSNQDPLQDLMTDMQGSKFSPQELPTSPVQDEQQAPPKNHNFWTIEYYQKYFDVNTDDVLRRIMCSLIPKRATASYFDQVINTKPDLYGPFWISTTLIFTIAISGNIANYIQNANVNYNWKYDFHLVSYAATAIFCYVWIVPMALWGALKWTASQSAAEQVEEGESSEPTMMALFCLYGYSLFIFIPVSILWTIQVYWLQWLLVLTGALVSGFVLVYLLLPALKRSRYSIVMIIIILALHLLLAAGFMLCFFHVPYVEPAPPAIITTPKPKS